MSTPIPHIAIIGAGPVGVEAALHAVTRGFDVRVFERGRVGDNICSWGHVNMFTPFGMNCTKLALSALRDSSISLPEEAAVLTGREFVEQYLQPLASLPLLENRIAEGTEVTTISRSHSWKGDHVGSKQRGNDPFLLCCQNEHEEWTEQADIILDCTGTYRHHNWAGAGGMPCPGERTYLSEKDYLIPDIHGRDRDSFLGKTTLVIGSGFSAATTVVGLAGLSASNLSSRVFWVTRGQCQQPMTRISDDTLPDRDSLAETANRLALDQNSPVTWLPGRLLRKITKTRDGFDALLELDSQQEPLSVDRIIANVGYRPNRSLYEELQIHECYATQGPMKLAAALLGETSSDCLSQSSHGAETLQNPEPGFFILGSKSYGRDSRFLLQIGHQQITDVFSLIGSVEDSEFRVES